MFVSIQKSGKVGHCRHLAAPGPAQWLQPLLASSPGGPGVLQPGEGVGVPGLEGRPLGEGEGQPGPPGDQVLQAQPGTDGQVCFQWFTASKVRFRWKSLWSIHRVYIVCGMVSNAVVWHVM